MRILFLGDIVGPAGCNAIKKNLKNIIKDENIDFTIANGENAADEGVGITQNILDEFLSCGIDIVTSGNHIWDQKETYEFIKNQTRLLDHLIWIKICQEWFYNFEFKKWFKIEF